MSAVSPPASIDRLNSGLGRGGVFPPEFGGGDNHGPDDGSPDYDHRMGRARMAVFLAMGSIFILFAAVTTAALLWQSSVRTAPYGAWSRALLPTRLLYWNTVILLLSSATVELARRALAREMLLAPVHAIAGISAGRQWRVPWLVITIGLGVAFLRGQWLAWKTLQIHGYHLSTVGGSSVFYLLTGAHAVHLGVGLLVLLYAVSASLLHLSLEHRHIVTDLTAWYWHFMAVLWLCIFGLLRFGTVS
jgi:cytochrome c oxidase subunit III